MTPRRKIGSTAAAACGLVLAALAASTAHRSGARGGAPPPLVRRIDPENPCGPVAAAMATHLLGRPLGLRQAGLSIETDPWGRCSIQQIVDGLEANGYFAAGVRFRSRDRISAVDGSCSLIAYVDGDHFVVLAPRDPGSLIVYDPPRRPGLYPIDGMPYSWRGEAILVARTREDLAGNLRRLDVAF